jgi:hypothetical protein
VQIVHKFYLGVKFIANTTAAITVTETVGQET